MSHRENVATTIAAPAAPATITEKELWAIFVSHTLIRTMSMGPTVEAYKPDDLLRDECAEGTMEPIVDEIADALAASDGPSVELDLRITEMTYYLENLKLIREDFTRTKEWLALYEHDVGEDPYKIDGKPQFQRPVIGSKMEAA